MHTHTHTCANTHTCAHTHTHTQKKLVVSWIYGTSTITDHLGEKKENIHTHTRAPMHTHTYTQSFRGETNKFHGISTIRDYLEGKRSNKEKEKKRKAYTHTQKHRIHSCKKKKKRKKRGTRPAETKINLGLITRSENSQTQILELKRTATLSNSHPYLNQREHHHQQSQLPKEKMKL